MAEELKKYFFHYKWLAVIFAFTIIKVLFSISVTYTVDDTIEQNKQQYLSYLSEMGGQLTADKEQAILAEFDRINAAVNETEIVREQFLKGYISGTQFAEKINALNEITSREDIFLKVFEQYEYASQDTDRREIIYTAGWEKLLTNDAPDLLLVLMIVLLASQPFAREYETEMTKILLPATNGRAKLCTCKLIVVLIAAVSGTLLFSFIDILTAARLGLDNFNAPLESIPLFCDTPEIISLLSALIMIELIRLLGYTIFSAGTLLLSSIFKKTLPAMCVSFGLILIQYTGFGASDFKYRYAIPYGLMLAGGYIKGESSNDNVQFDPIMPEELAMIISVSVLCLVLLSAMVICSFSSRKGIKSIAVILGMSMLLCGCENHDTAVQYFRLNGSEWTDGRNYVFSYLGNGTMINKSTNETNDFIRNPFYDIETDSDKMPITAPIYAVGKKAYYLFDNGVSIIIRERNLDDMSEKVVYENGGDERNYFLGLGHSYADSHSYTINGFFLNDKYIYFVTDRGITQFNRLTSAHSEIIADSRIENVIFDGVDIYYISSDFSLMKYISELGTTEQVISDKLSDCVIVDETIYYCNIEDGKTLYKCGLDEKNKEKLAEYPIKALTTDGEYIYFIASDSLCGEVYRISVKSTAAELFYEGNAYFVYAFSGYDKVLVKVHDESGVMTMVEILKCMEESSLL